MRGVICVRAIPVRIKSAIPISTRPSFLKMISPHFCPVHPRLGNPNHALLQVQAQAGTCRVICFSPRHDPTLAQMGTDEIRQVVDVGVEQTAELGQPRWWFNEHLTPLLLNYADLELKKASALWCKTKIGSRWFLGGRYGRLKP